MNEYATVPLDIGVEMAEPYRDGTTHVVLEPLDFVARLAALVPRPRAHLTRYHGVFGIEIETCEQCGGAYRKASGLERRHR